MSNAPVITGDTARPAAPKLLGLELLRFACAVVVLIWHFQHFAMIGDDSGLAREHQPLSSLLWPVYRYGSYGVQVFWCISGLIFYWKYADAIAARTVEPRRFFWLRFSRLYPLHFLTLLAVATLQPLYRALTGEWLVYDNSLSSFTLQLALGDQWFGARELSFNGPIWSVSAEVFVYVAFFMMMRAFGRRPWIIVAAILCGLWAILSGGVSAPVVCAAFFFAGGLAADWLQSERAARRPREARRTAVAIIIALVALIAAFVDLDPAKPITSIVVLALCPPIMFLLSQDLPLLDRFQRPIEAAGNLTYSTYLVHFPMQLAFAIAAVATGYTIPIDQAWFLAAYLGVVLIAGRLVFTRFEAPMQELIRNATLGPSRFRAMA